MRNSRLVFVCLAVLLFSSFSFMFVPRVHADYVAGSFTVTASVDTAVQSDYPNTQNSYTNTSLAIGTAASPFSIHEGWYKFSMQSNYLGPLTITSAQVEMYYSTAVYGSPPRQMILESIDPSNETWIDSTITWNNMPTMTTIESFFTITSTPQTLVFPIENNYENSGTNSIQLLQTAYDTNNTKTYFMLTDNYFVGSFFTQESTIKPILVVNYLINTETGGVSPTPTGNAVNLMNFAAQLNLAFGAPSTSLLGEMLATLIFTCLFLFPILFFCSKTQRDTTIPTLIVGFLGLGVGVVAFSLPFWVFLIIFMLVAALMAGVFRDWLSGRGGDG